MKNTKISIIVARTPRGVIGNNNSLIWKIPEDLKNFKKVTSGKPIIMGRKTYESIGSPLKDRKNIIVSRNKDIVIENAEVASSLEHAIEIAKKDYTGEIMLIGGSQLYLEAIQKKYVNKIYETLVFANLEGDAFFIYDEKSFELISSNKLYSDSKNEYDFEFRILIEK